MTTRVIVLAFLLLWGIVILPFLPFPPGFYDCQAHREFLTESVSRQE